MRPELLRVVEFAQQLDAIHSLNALDREIEDVLSPFGIRHYAAHRVFDPGYEPRPGVFFGKVNHDWVNHYITSGLVTRDPTVKMLFETTRPYSWSEARNRFPGPEGEAVMDECAEHTGCGDGLVIPIHTVDGAIHSALFSGEALDISPEERGCLHLLGYYYVMRGQELLTGDKIDEVTSPLTPRQAECLKWVSQGKTDEDIGLILGLSARTVHHHIEGAKTNLGVTKRSQAAFAAYRRGWIS